MSRKQRRFPGDSRSQATPTIGDRHPTSAITHRDQLECAWKNFSFIAELRMKSFNFYVILLAASIGGTLTVFEKLSSPRSFFLCGVWHVLLATVFCLVDLRCRNMMNVPVKALDWVENLPEWDGPKAFGGERLIGWKRIASFTFAYRATFLLQAMSGIALITYAMVRH